MAEVCNVVPETFAVLSGDDAVTLPLIALGGVGIISVASNEIPHKMVRHRSGSGQCNHGKGRPVGHDANHARWHGPYRTLSEAREASHHMPGVLIRSECKCI